MNDFKYTVKRTSQFKRDYKLAIKRGFKAGLLKRMSLKRWQKENRFRKRIGIIRWPETGLVTVNAVFRQIGCSFTVSTMMCWF